MRGRALHHVQQPSPTRSCQAELDLRPPCSGSGSREDSEAAAVTNCCEVSSSAATSPDLPDHCRGSSWGRDWKGQAHKQHPASLRSQPQRPPRREETVPGVGGRPAGPQAQAKGAGTTCPPPSRTGWPEPDLSTDAQAPPATQAAPGPGSLTTESIPSHHSRPQDVGLQTGGWGGGPFQPPALLQGTSFTSERRGQTYTKSHLLLQLVCSCVNAGHEGETVCSHHAAGPPASNSQNTGRHTGQPYNAALSRETWKCAGNEDRQRCGVRTPRGRRGWERPGRWPGAPGRDRSQRSHWVVKYQKCTEQLLEKTQPMIN